MLSSPHPKRPGLQRAQGLLLFAFMLASLTGCTAAFTASPRGVASLPPQVVDTPPQPLVPIPSPSSAETLFDAEGTGLRVPILLYHRISLPSSNYPRLFVPPAAFEAQMAAIAASNVATLTMEDLVTAVKTGKRFAGGALAVTFDDASEDQYTAAFPVLLRYGIRASLFVPTERIGRPGSLTWPQLQTMVASGLIAIEAHSITHRDLTVMDDARAMKEIAGSRAVLRARLGVPVSTFAYPYGRFSRRIESFVARAGYYCAVTTQWRWTHSPKDALTWGRMEVHAGFPGPYLADLARLSGTWIEAPAALQAPPVRRRPATPTPRASPTPAPKPTASPTPKPTATKTP